jgi:uncharacterized protein YbjQ (UPF0145 family)
MESALKAHGLNLMRVSFAAAPEDGRRTVAIGRIRATGPWRAAGLSGAEADRQAAIDALTREAEEYGADSVIDVQFEVEGCKGCEIDGLRLERVTASGLAVRFVEAA